MGSGFNVSVAEIRAHATTVTELAAAVRTASTNAQNAVTGGAFGEIGEFFAQFITQAADQVREGISRASQAVDQVQQGLNAVAELYEAIDQLHSTLFDKAVPTAGEKR